MKIAFLTNIPSPYRVDFFNELGKYCDLTVYFEKSVSDERDESWTVYSFKCFNGIILYGKSVAPDKAFAPEIKKRLKENKYDHVIVGNPFTLTGIYAISYMKRQNFQYWIEGDGAFPKKENFLKKLLKMYILKGAKGYFSTADMHDKYLLSYGVNKELIYRYPFSSVKEENILTVGLNKEEKRNIKNKLDIYEDKIILSVGQFIYRKGFDILLRAICTLDKSIGIYIIGGTPTTELKNYVIKYNLTNVHFLKFQKPEQLREYYMASDVFVLPTREDIWGLVVNEALAVGVPVVTTDKCISGLELVRNGMNGYIVSSENDIAMRNAIVKVLEGDGEKMAIESLKISRFYTIQEMAKRHISILEKT